MTWRVARSLIQLREQVNKKFPERAKVADGTIGDAAHATRTSDHNPWVKDEGMGIVTGMDITNDPAHGLNSEDLANCLRQMKDSRLKYVISNRKIASFDHEDFKWRPYNGANAHNHHCHISVRPDKKHYDDIKPWKLDNLEPPAPSDAPHPIHLPMLSLGSQGDTVALLQTKLNAKHAEPQLRVDQHFGVATEEAVKSFQQAHGLTPDGKVGPYTWEKLDA